MSSRAKLHLQEAKAGARWYDRDNVKSAKEQFVSERGRLIFRCYKTALR